MNRFVFVFMPDSVNTLRQLQPVLCKLDGVLNDYCLYVISSLENALARGEPLTTGGYIRLAIEGGEVTRIGYATSYRRNGLYGAYADYGFVETDEIWFSEPNRDDRERYRDFILALRDNNLYQKLDLDQQSVLAQVHPPGVGNHSHRDDGARKSRTGLTGLTSNPFYSRPLPLP